MRYTGLPVRLVCATLAFANPSAALAKTRFVCGVYRVRGSLHFTAPSIGPSGAPLDAAAQRKYAPNLKLWAGTLSATEFPVVMNQATEDRLFELDRRVVNGEFDIAIPQAGMNPPYARVLDYRDIPIVKEAPLAKDFTAVLVKTRECEKGR